MYFIPIYLQVVLQTIDNPVPEERREFTFLVTSATGGATVSTDNSKSTIIYSASDYPFGLFGFNSASPVSISEVSDTV